MFCIYCRNPFDENSETFCSKCGKELYKERIASDSTPESEIYNESQLISEPDSHIGLTHTCERCGTQFPVVCYYCNNPVTDTETAVPPECYMGCEHCGQTFWVLCPECNEQEQEQEQELEPEQSPQPQEQPTMHIAVPSADLTHICLRCGAEFPVSCTHCGSAPHSDTAVPPEGYIACGQCGQSFWVICPHCQQIQEQKEEQQQPPPQQTAVGAVRYPDMPRQPWPETPQPVTPQPRPPVTPITPITRMPNVPQVRYGKRPNWKRRLPFIIIPAAVIIVITTIILWDPPLFKPAVDDEKENVITDNTQIQNDPPSGGNQDMRPNDTSVNEDPPSANTHQDEPAEHIVDLERGIIVGQYESHSTIMSFDADGTVTIFSPEYLSGYNEEYTGDYETFFCAYSISKPYEPVTSDYHIFLTVIDGRKDGDPIWLGGINCKILGGEMGTDTVRDGELQIIPLKIEQYSNPYDGSEGFELDGGMVFRVRVD